MEFEEAQEQFNELGGLKIITDRLSSELARVPSRPSDSSTHSEAPLLSMGERGVVRFLLRAGSHLHAQPLGAARTDVRPSLFSTLKSA